MAQPAPDRQAWRPRDGAGRATVSYKQPVPWPGWPTATTPAPRPPGPPRGNHGRIVPCHRVLRADGRLGGYGWGTHRKAWLLSHEQALVPMPGLAGSG